MKPAHSTFVELRGMRHHVLTWGDPSAPTIFMLHGWMDVGASFQFLVDAFTRDWHVVAPDLRGFGGSQWQPQGYWFYDYIADLEALVDHYAPGESVDLLGHSLGGNIVMQYAGVRPTRVRRVVSLEGFGIPAESSDLAPTKVAKWLDALHTMPEFQTYTGLPGVADRLQKNNSRLKREQAEFLASHWAETTSDGARLTSDPRHKLPFPIVYRMDEVTAIWRNIQAPTLWVAAAQTTILRWLERGTQARHHADGFDIVRQRMANIKGARLEIVADAGHMLHHDQPAAVARLIEPFFTPA